MTEILDLVDEDDNIINTLPRKDIYDQGLKYVRTVEAFIRNSAGQLWIPVRTDDKVYAPGGFDMGVGGHIEHGEEAADALAKEISEEIGWNVGDLEYRQIGKFGPREGLATFSYVYEITTDSEPIPNPDDFKSATWMTPQEVADAIKAGHPAKSNLIVLLQNVYKVRT